MAIPDRLERLTDLVLVLLDAPHPLTLEQIAREVPGYPERHEPRRQAFERDKRLLRQEGIPVDTVWVDGPEQYGYQIDPSRYYLPELDLTADERTALHLAVAGVHLGDPTGRAALDKLGATGPLDAGPVAAMAPPPGLVPLFQATMHRAEVNFGYRGSSRTVAPGGVWFRRGHWYLVGWDRDREALRTFRIDRLDTDVSVGDPGTGDLPDGVDPAAGVPDEPWRVGEGQDQGVDVLVDRVEAARVLDEVGPKALSERRSDGSVVVLLEVTNPDALRTWLLGLLDHAEALGPPEVRAGIVDWLEATIASAEAPIEAPADDGLSAKAGAPPSDRPTPAGAAPQSGPLRHAGARLQRLFAVVGWLARNGEATIAEVSERFGVPEEELVRELELAACCGVPPYTPDTLMEIVVTGTSVQAFLPAELGTPRRLTAEEGFALVAAGRTILAVPGADPDGGLASAVAKLEGVLGNRPGLVVDLDEPPLLGPLRDASAHGAVLEIEYHSGSKDETTTRVIEPHRVVALDGRWYVDAYCRQAAGTRRFRIDRVRSARPIDDDTERLGPEWVAGGQSALVEGPVFVPGPDAERVLLKVEPQAAWVLDGLAALSRQPCSDGGEVVELAVGGRAWLWRLLLQLGPGARVLSPPEHVAAAARAARSVLERYR